jgi:hypothetical protein
MAQKIIAELIALSLLGMVYLTAFAPILTEAVTNYTGGGTIGAALATVVGYLPIVVIAIIFVQICMGAFKGGKY